MFLYHLQVTGNVHVQAFMLDLLDTVVSVQLLWSGLSSLNNMQGRDQIFMLNVLFISSVDLQVLQRLEAYSVYRHRTPFSKNLNFTYSRCEI